MNYQKEIHIDWIALTIANDDVLTISVLKHRLRYLDSLVEELEEEIQYAVDSLAETEMKHEINAYEYEIYCIDKMLHGMNI